jgi:hypothetical protein
MPICQCSKIRNQRIANVDAKLFRAGARAALWKDPPRQTAVRAEPGASKIIEAFQIFPEETGGGRGIRNHYSVRERAIVGTARIILRSIIGNLSNKIIQK